MKNLLSIILFLFICSYSGLCQNPVASAITITESRSVANGHLLTGSYTFTSTSSTEGVSTYRWLVSTNLLGTDAVPIVGSNTWVYTVNDTVLGKYIGFEVTPVDLLRNSGLPDTVYFGPLVNNLPSITLSAISGTRLVNTTISSLPTYSDSEGNLQGADSIQWFGSSVRTGPYTPISGATSGSFNITINEKDLFIYQRYSSAALTGNKNAVVAYSDTIQVVNTAPVGTKAKISGTIQVGQSISSIPAYYDLEGDVQGSSAYQWYRSATLGGAYTAISGASANSYTITLSDKDQYLCMTYLPVAVSGTSPGAIVYSDTVKVVNIAPVGTKAKISGTIQVGQSISSTPGYSDLEGDVQGSSVYQWYRSATLVGAYTAISGASANSYTLTLSDKDQYLYMTYLPVASMGNSPGAIVYSDTVQVANTAPVGTKAKITGTIQVGKSISSTPGYSDLEGDVQGSSVYQWYRSATLGGAYAAISGASANSYTLTLSDKDQYLYMTYVPGAASGTSPGVMVYSDTVQVANTAPVGTKAKITGTFLVGQNISFLPVYYDLEGDLPGTPIYQWYHCTTLGGVYTAISGASANSYTITLSDKDQYLFMAYTPVAATGTLTGITVNSDTIKVQNLPPVGTVTNISGTHQIGKTLSVSISYTDLEQDLQGISVYQWYQCSSKNGTYTPVSGATSVNFTVTLANKDQFLYFAYTPIAKTGTYDGLTVISDTIQISNTAPYVSNITISGTQIVCKTLTGTYTYNDLEGDVEDLTTFRWLRSNSPTEAKTAIDGAISATYTLTKADQGKYIYFEVTPKAKAGILNGVASQSSGTGSIINLLPTVTFIGGGAICQGKSLSLMVSFTGTPNYELTYTDGVNLFSLSTSLAINTISISKAGTFKGISLKDNLNCIVGEADLTSSTTVTVNSLPVVAITGLNNAYSVNSTAVLLTGTPLGGTFSGPGVVSSSNTFYPSIAGVSNSPHSIVYTYTSPTAGCTNSDTVKVNVYNASALISGIRSGSKYCNYDNPFLITGVNLSNIIGTFTITGGIGLKDNRNNTATITPSLLGAGTFTISYVYFDNVSQTITASLTVETADRAKIIGLSKLNYCKNDEPVKLIGNFTTGIFSGNGVVKSNLDVYYFEPDKSANGKNSIYYNNTTSYGCSSTDSAILNTIALPRLQFDFSNKCWNGDSTGFLNISEPVDSISSWKWSFGDLAATSAQNSSTVQNPKHLYTYSGDKTIQLIAQNILSCRDTLIKTLHLGAIPDVYFNWNKECFVTGQKVSFSNLTGNTDPIKSYKWIIRDTAYSDLSVKYKFPSVDNYVIKLFATSTYNCVDSSVQTLHLRPIHAIKESTYFNNFESASNSWYPISGKNSNWQWITPGGSTINKPYSGTKSYVTTFGGVRSNQQLEISSECFDFTGIAKPYIELWINSNSVQNSEGAVLQYIQDDSVTWKTVGDVGSGINWYSGSNITSSPGGQKLGWTGTTNGWIQVRHNLDSLQNKQNVKFRIVYGENAATSTSEGFAFDDVFIGQRSKNILFEHFTNYGLLTGRNANTALYKILDQAGSDAIPIQYHTSITGVTDSLNLNNPVDPNNRALFYNFTNIPNCVLDGGAEAKYIYDFSTKIPSISDVNTRLLRDPLFDIKISATHKVPDIDGTVKITALNSITKRSVTLHVAIVEDITVQEDGVPKVYYNVLRKLLPSSGAFTYNMAWLAGEEKDTTYSWTYQKVYDSAKIKVVAFVQDDESKEVYQVMSLLTDPITGISPITEGDNFKAYIYPNPVNNLANLAFGSTLKSNATLKLFNCNGSLVKNLLLYRGISAVELNSTDLPNGLYLAQLILSPSEVITLKMMVVH